MNFKNKIIALTLTFAMITSKAFSDSCPPVEDPCCDPCGSCYNECCDSCCLAPAMALGAVVIVTVVLVCAKQSLRHHHAH